MLYFVISYYILLFYSIYLVSHYISSSYVMYYIDSSVPLPTAAGLFPKPCP